MRVKNTLLYYKEDGTQKSISNTTQLIPCSREHFNRSAFQLEYYDAQKKSGGDKFQPLCFSPEALSTFALQGFQTSREAYLNNSYINMLFYRCDHESTPEEQRANCAESSTINDWLYDKVFEPYVFQEYAALSNFSHPIQERIQRQVGIPMNPKLKTSVWGRIRENKWTRKDAWY